MCIARVVDSDAPPQSLVCMALISKLLGRADAGAGTSQTSMVVPSLRVRHPKPNPLPLKSIDF